ncbi:hypothetical protein GSI_04922 [Ganoderma sinense ZZ0214-1]|uniref:Uncharacterized protein n=1 Tax=Ganoderma sinense ZZ0214-1 TaxID=1077348 RepID=A0A2G8SG97_9APHY|nr:hypothetical protein GSI_04922 [Ganoderma sinense ZZ0214-1]
MSNHPSIPNWREGPKRTFSFATGFSDPVMPSLWTPVHNGPSMTVVYDPTVKFKKDHDPKPAATQKKNP